MHSGSDSPHNTRPMLICCGRKMNHAERTREKAHAPQRPLACTALLTFGSLLDVAAVEVRAVCEAACSDANSDRQVQGGLMTNLPSHLCAPAEQPAAAKN